MIKIFAVQPEIMAHPDYFREYFKDFGSDKGRWIGLFPSDWRRQVKNLIQGTSPDLLPPLKKNSMKDKILQGAYRDRFIQIPESFVGECTDWLTTAESLVDSSLAEAVLANSNPRSNQKVLVAGIFDPECPCYKSTTNLRIRKNPESLFENVRSVVRFAKSLDIIDPYVQNTGQAAKSFAKFLDLILKELRVSGAACKEIGVHLKKPDVFNAGVQQANFQSLLSTILEIGETISINFWDLNPEADRNHDRHLITDAAAMMSSYGWAEDASGTPTTDISLKNSDTHRRLVACFRNKATQEFGILENNATITIKKS